MSLRPPDTGKHRYADDPGRLRMRGYPEQAPHDLVETTDAPGCAADDIDHVAPAHVRGVLGATLTSGRRGRHRT